jgi:hypothetical protein
MKVMDRKVVIIIRIMQGEVKVATFLSNHVKWSHPKRIADFLFLPVCHLAPSSFSIRTLVTFIQVQLIVSSKGPEEPNVSLHNIPSLQKCTC